MASEIFINECTHKTDINKLRFDELMNEITSVNRKEEVQLGMKEKQNRFCGK